MAGHSLAALLERAVKFVRHIQNTACWFIWKFSIQWYRCVHNKNLVKKLLRNVLFVFMLVSYGFEKNIYLKTMKNSMFFFFHELFTLMPKYI